MSEPVRVVIGLPETDGLVLSVLGRSHPDATDYWDGNWIRTAIDARVGAFSASYVGDLRVDEFERFRVELEHQYEVVEAASAFHTLEGWLDLEFKGDGLGHIEVTGELLDTPGVGNVLRFTLPLDRTYLPPIIDSLREVEATWPVVGRP